MIIFVCLLRKIKLNTLFEYKQNNIFIILFIDVFFIIENLKL